MPAPPAKRHSRPRAPVPAATARPPGDHDHDAAGTATAGPGASTRKDAHPTRDDPAVTDLGIRASGGDRQAWDALVERYAPPIWAICRGHQLRDAHADDVGQAVWLHLAGHLDSLRDPAPVTAWLATTRRECHRILRTMRDLPTDRRELQNMPDDQTPAEHELLAAERDAAQREAFAHLPRRPATACHAHLRPPAPYAEISARLGVPVGSIGPNRRRYLDRLRRDPALARLISAQAAGGDQAPAPTRNAQPAPAASPPPPHAAAGSSGKEGRRGRLENWPLCTAYPRRTRHPQEARIQR
jgi:RNA polymerase sigma factor (sigma-70 family)